MASLLSRAVRGFTGQSIGENIGGALGQAFGGTTGRVIGSSIGGTVTEAIDPRKQQQGQSVAVSQATQTNPQETQASGSTGGVVYNQNIMPASFANIPQQSIHMIFCTNHPHRQMCMGNC